MMMQENLLKNIDKIHTTELGVVRIRRNLNLQEMDVVSWCREGILRHDAQTERRGKNWYVSIDSTIITVNAHSFTIITAHRLKNIE